MRNIGLFYNPRLLDALPLAQEIAAWLQERAVATWICSTHDAPSPASLLQTELLITLGGDGTILRAMSFAAPFGLPVLGLNLGRVGFLTECEPQSWTQSLEKILAGQGRVEERVMLQVTLLRGTQTLLQDIALNDVVISRGSLARAARLLARVDGTLLTQYVADGLILATATGSTAYSYAVGGPILPPWLKNILLVPVAAHLCLDRPLVLDAEAVVEITVQTGIPGMLTVDGRVARELRIGDRVRARRSPLKARFLRLSGRADFYRTLAARLTPRNGGE